ncbi:MAG TPA: hypothetical protein DCF42_07030 [Lachnospiraceae bacterium]|nr:hypothetical protein [Lachnospiraceae bacterium]
MNNPDARRHSAPRIREFFRVFQGTAPGRYWKKGKKSCKISRSRKAEKTASSRNGKRRHES